MAQRHPQTLYPLDHELSEVVHQEVLWGTGASFAFCAVPRPLGRVEWSIHHWDRQEEGMVLCCRGEEEAASRTLTQLACFRAMAHHALDCLVKASTIDEPF